MVYVINNHKIIQEIAKPLFLSYGNICPIGDWVYTLYDFHGVDILALEEEIYTEDQITKMIQEYKDENDCD